MGLCGLRTWAVDQLQGVVAFVGGCLSIGCTVIEDSPFGLRRVQHEGYMTDGNAVIGVWG